MPNNDVDIDQTIDSPVQPIATRDVVAAPKLVHGSTPGLTGEINALLADRLRSAALILFSGFAAFLLRRLFDPNPLGSSTESALLYMHVAVTLISGFIGFRMCFRCPLVHNRVRITEAVLFGTTTVFFALASYTLLTEGARNGYLASISSMWVILIFTYALFIPNTWRRAAAVILIFVIVATGTMLFVKYTSADYKQVAENPQMRPRIIENFIVLALSAGAAVWGVYSMSRLRRQAYEAKQLGQYRLKRLLGSGGMGEVHLAEHTLLKRPCAIKLIRPEKAGDRQSLERFEREVQATARLTHWNTVEIFDYGHSDDGTFYYAMEYLPGMNLDQIVQMYGPLPAERTVYLMLQICDALSEAHDTKLVHRDIKPANIFVAHRGGVFDVAKLLDFGLVKPLLTTDDDLELTRDGAIAGSPLFLSPEQALGEQTDHRADIYSIGSVMYFMLTGQPPFSESSAIKTLFAHAHRAPDEPSSIFGEIPDDLEQIVMRCLRKVPEDRYDSTAELARALSDSELAEQWDRDKAKIWWQAFGCPDKKRLDSDVLEAVY